MRRCGTIDGNRRGSQGERFEESRHDADMAEHGSENGDAAVVSGLETHAGADRGRMVHRTILMIAVVQTSAFERRGLRASDEKCRHQGQGRRLNDEPERCDRCGKVAYSRHWLSVHERVSQSADAARDT